MDSSSGKRQRDTGAAQERPPGDVFLRDEHSWRLLTVAAPCFGAVGHTSSYSSGTGSRFHNAEDQSREAIITL